MRGLTLGRPGFGAGFWGGFILAWSGFLLADCSAQGWAGAFLAYAGGAVVGARMMSTRGGSQCDEADEGMRR